LDEFLAEVAHNTGFRTVHVNKKRRQFVFRGCVAEFVRLRTGAIVRDSFCIEDEVAARVIAALHELGLDSRANVNFPKGLERALIGAL
jgi:hypothetical protein